MKVSYYLEKKPQGMFIADLIKSNIYEFKILLTMVRIIKWINWDIYSKGQNCYYNKRVKSKHWIKLEMFSDFLKHYLIYNKNCKISFLYIATSRVKQLKHALSFNVYFIVICNGERDIWFKVRMSAVAKSLVNYKYLLLTSRPKQNWERDEGVPFTCACWYFNDTGKGNQYCV